MGANFCAFYEAQLPHRGLPEHIRRPPATGGWELLGTFDLGKAYEFAGGNWRVVPVCSSEVQDAALGDQVMVLEGAAAIERACLDARRELEQDAAEAAEPERDVRTSARYLQYVGLGAAAHAFPPLIPVRVLVVRR